MSLKKRFKKAVKGVGNAVANVGKGTVRYAEKAVDQVAEHVEQVGKGVAKIGKGIERVTEGHINWKRLLNDAATWGLAEPINYARKGLKPIVAPDIPDISIPDNPLPPPEAEPDALELMIGKGRKRAKTGRAALKINKTSTTPRSIGVNYPK